MAAYHFAGCWKPLYRTGGWAALLTALFIPIQVAVFLRWLPPSGGSPDVWFALFQENRWAALVDLDLLLIADNLLLIPIILAICVSTGRGHESIVAIAAALGFLGIVLYVATNPALEMLSLSNQYEIAATDSQRRQALGAGAALLAAWQGTAFHVAYIAGSTAGILLGILMLRSGIFGAVASYLAIVGNAVGLGLYIPVIGLYISVFSVLFLELWYLLLGRRLLQLGQENS
jgi:hypothetical protein